MLVRRSFMRLKSG
ncbi:hypothetical protein LINPERPRIM_LOCUS39365 [Linum perenne]